LKIDKSVNDMLKRLESIISTTPGYSTGEDDADYEEDEATIQHRFACYRAARAKKTAPALMMDGNGFTYEDVYDTITQEELDYFLKQRLKISPEERYQHAKKRWYMHESSYLHQTRDENTGKAVDIIKEYGCGRYENNPRGCVPECRYYNPTGRIEDSEVIQKHRELEKKYRDNNAIVEPPSSN
jgi:LPS sulfotransferase NodH